VIGLAHKDALYQVSSTFAFTSGVNTGYIGGGQSVVGDDVSTVLYQSGGRVRGAGRHSIPAVLRGVCHCFRPSSSLRRTLGYRMVNDAHRRQQIRRRLPPIPG